MARQSASISSSTGCRTVLQLLVRLLLVGLVLLVVLEPPGAEGGSVAGSVAGKRTSTVDSAPEEEDSSAAVDASDELLEEEEEQESFEQDVNGTRSRKANDSDERETVTVRLSSEDPASGGTETTTLGYNAVATTPKIVEKPVKKLSRYEQGLEDYDEAADRAEREQKEQVADQQYNNMLKPMLTLFNVISTVLSSGRSMRSQLATADGGSKNENITFGAGKSTSGADNENETATAVTGGRYIKGDPLNGYYDFVISEGSYKFWVVFQLFTAGLVLYATFAAIYYSKVSPLTSDYDYIDYLNGARSFAGGRSMVAQPVGSTVWDTVANSRWFGPAAQAFEIVMTLATVEGRYIKGDPLNGYYDFVISEGSYKFWAVFQLVTAAVVIYSTLTAIYYSKVAPLTSDYDYIDYLNGGRSFAGARPVDASPRGGGSRGSGGRGRASGWSWDSLSTNSWFGPAAQAFTIVMDAIERQPK